MGSSWVPFRYAGFYDVPERILIAYRGDDFLLEPYYDDEADEYKNFYYGYDDAGRGPNPNGLRFDQEKVPGNEGSRWTVCRQEVAES
jgi:hypothetical protein